MVRRTLITAAMLFACILFLTGTAFAWDESTTTVPGVSEEACGPCHQVYSGAEGVFNGIAIHGGYLATTQKCDKCHTVHAAPAGSVMLLPGATIKATCMTCHDGTQGRGVYGAIAARGLAVGSVHRCETTNSVPGGNASTGGASTMAFGGQSGTLSCDDCHTPHGASAVAGFSGERRRTATAISYNTNRLLKQRPGNVATAAPVYGSDWCGSCHQGRRSGAAVHNHPVDSTMTVGASAFYYDNVARLTTDAPTGLTQMGTIGRTNRGYLMPMPRTAQQSGHAPICQQCHEDARSVGTLDFTGAVGDAATFTVSALDGSAATDNPRFQNFPHEATNVRFLVETNDDLCTNCHPAAVLP